MKLVIREVHEIDAQPWTPQGSNLKIWSADVTAEIDGTKPERTEVKVYSEAMLKKIAVGSVFNNVERKTSKGNNPKTYYALKAEGQNGGGFGGRGGGAPKDERAILLQSAFKAGVHLHQGTGDIKGALASADAILSWFTKHYRAKDGATQGDKPAAQAGIHVDDHPLVLRGHEVEVTRAMLEKFIGCPLEEAAEADLDLADYALKSVESGARKASEVFK